MSLRNEYALVLNTRAGCNININIFSFVFNTSVEIGSAYLYCVKYLLNGNILTQKQINRVIEENCPRSPD